MKTLAAGMQAMLDGSGHSLATLMVITRTDGQVFRFCALDRNLEYPANSGNVYQSALGYTRADIQTSDALDVDNTNVQGALTSDSITDEDLRAGKWDRASFRLFMVNYENLADGEIKMRRGTLGEVTQTRNRFEAELRGLMQAYSRVIGRIDSPDCDAVFGDSRCGINAADTSTSGFTVTGTVEAISADQLTIFDSARTEPGPSESVGILSITRADPGVVTTDGPHGLIEGQAAVIFGVLGMTAVNTAQIVRNPTDTTFEIVNTSDFPAYVSGGMVSSFSDAGWFDYGKMTMTSGAAIGDSMEVKAYTADSSGGLIVLQLPMFHTVAPGDTYALVAGCDKTLATCKDKFDNVINFRGFPYLRGNDALAQVGRHGGG